MHRHTVLFFSAMITGLPLSALAGPQSVPTDSFIGRHVSTVSELHQQISLDPVVRRRLARHFHTSAPAVTRYIQDNLVLKNLPHAGRYKVYCISRTGQEYTIDQHLAAGTPVFVLRSTGQPVLKLACGNPMVAGLPPVRTKVAAYHSPELAGMPAPGPALIAPALESNAPVVVAINDTPTVAVMPTTKVAGFIGQLPIVHGGSPLGFLAAIPVLATVFGTHHGGGGSTPTAGTTGTPGAPGTTGTPGAPGTTGTPGAPGTTGTPGAPGTTGANTGTTVTPVPEPSTPAAFAVGGMFLLFLLNGAKRRSRSKTR